MSMGLGPLNAIYQAHFNRYLHNRRIVDTSDSRVWCFLGDGECDEPETLGALSLAAREQLDNLIFVVNCNLQRLDGPVRGNGKIIQELEATFRGAGWNVIKVVWGSQVGRAARPGRRRRAAQQDEHHRRRRVPEVRHRGRVLHPRALLRARSASAGSGGAPVRRRPAQPAPRRPRLPQAVRRLQGGHGDDRAADRDPGQDHQGLDARTGDRGPQLHPPDQEDDPGPAEAAPGPPLPAGGDPRLGAREGRAAVLLPVAGLGRVPVHDRAAPGPQRVAAAPGGAGQAAAGARPRRPSPSSRRIGQAGGVHDHGLRRHAAQPAAGQGDRPADGSDHPRRGPHLRHGRALQRGEDLRPPRPAVRAGRLQAHALLLARPGTGRSWRRASPRRGAWPTSPPPVRRMRRGASR